MRFSRFPHPPGQSFSRRSADDEDVHPEPSREPAPLSQRAAQAAPDRSAPPPEGNRAASPGSLSRVVPAGTAEAREDTRGAPLASDASSEAEPAPDDDWRPHSLIDELAAEAEIADAATADTPAARWTEDPVPPDPDRVPARSRPASMADEDDADQAADELDDIAVTIGRVVSIRGSVVWGALFDDDDGTAARAARMGALVSMRGPDSRVFGIVNALKRDGNGGGPQSERTIFEIQVLGEISTVTPGAKAAGFQRGVSSYPPLDAPVTTVTLRDLAAVYARPRISNVHIGRLRHNHKVPAFVLTDSLLGKHFAVLGTTGAGKSCAVSVVLRSILDELPNGHVVLLDPHNEYASAFADRAELLNPSNLQLPYWLLNFEEIGHILIGGSANEHSFAQTAILKDAIMRAKRAFVGEQGGDEHLTIDTPTPYRLADLIAALKEGMGMLNRADGSGPYLSLIARTESLRNDRRYAFMFASLAVRDNMRQILAQLLRIPVEGKPITIIDISGVPSEIVDVVVSVLFRLVFELAVWSDRGSAPPVLLVCEEAHRYVPEHDAGGFAPTKRVISRIAKEGRKYGVTLCLVSQRPSELSIGSLSQCNTVFALRLTNEHDQAFVARALPENARWLVDSLPSLNTQEAVVVGDGVTVPVHIRFKDLERTQLPSGANPSFAASWREEPDQGFLDRAIERWRLQTR
jgi:DNA helicase HerA-like ATPase